jgi:pimeloyl-ACP methyl ester carboxylesterase
MAFFIPYDHCKGVRNIMMDISSIQERKITLSHGKTYYMEAGEGEPVIFLHGVGFWSGGDYWIENMVELGKYYRVLAPDFLGWGKGDRLSIEYSFAYLVDFVREFQDALGIASAHIVGHSMGGWVAALLAYESPERVKTLTIVAGGGMATRTLKTMTSFKPSSFEEVLEHIKKTRPSNDIDLVSYARRCYERTLIPGHVEAYQRILNHMNDPVNRSRYNLKRRLPYIHHPTLLIWGSNDQVNDISLGEEMHALLPHSEMKVFPCGHFIPSEKPAEFNSVLLEFLKKSHKDHLQ